MAAILHNSTVDHKMADSERLTEIVDVWLVWLPIPFLESLLDLDYFLWLWHLLYNSLNNIIYLKEVKMEYKASYVAGNIKL